MDYRWDDLRAFLAVWRAGSLSGAAVTLGVNPSTVGRRLDALQDALDTQLFERTPEGVVATLAAEQLLPFAEGVEQAHVGFARALSGLEREPEGRVRVTGPPGLIDHFVAPALGDLRSAFPRLSVVLDASVGYADLSRGEADIALRAVRPTHGDLVSQQLGPFSSAVVGAAGLAAGPARALEGLPWSQWSDELLHIPDARWVAEHVPDTAIVLRTGSFAAMVEAARAGVAVFFAPEPFARLEGLGQVPLVAHPALQRVPAQPIHLVGHQALRRVPRVAVVWSFLRELLLGTDQSPNHRSASASTSSA